MNKKIFFSIISIVTALGLAGGATYAFFSSTATSTANAFGAGTLTLQVNDADQLTPAPTVTASFGTSGMKPGDTTSGFVSLDNTGTINIAKIKMTATKDSSSTNDLADVLDITTAKLGTENTCISSPTDLLPGWITAIGGIPTLKQMVTKGVFNAVPSGLTAGTTRFLCIAFTMESGASNTYQGATTQETFSFEGDQDNSQ